MSRKLLWGIAGALCVPLALLLMYSFDRSAEMMAIFEGGAGYTGFLGFSGKTLGGMAALVMELAVIGFVVGLAVSSLLPEKHEARTIIDRWGKIGLIVSLAAMWLINLISGGLRGWQTVYTQIDQGGANDRVALAVSGVTWLLINSLVPLMIYALTEIIAHVVKMAILWRPSGWKQTMDDLRTALERAETAAKQAQTLANERQSTIEQQQTLIEQQADRIVASAINPDDRRWLANILQMLNKDHGLSYRTLAPIFDVSPATISKMINEEV